MLAPPFYVFLCLVSLESLVTSLALVRLESPGKAAQSEICCQEENLQSCEEAEVDAKALTEEEIEIMGTSLHFSNLIGLHSRAYKNEGGDEAVVSYNPNTAHMFLTLKTRDGGSYALERCHRGHVWKQFNVTSFGENDSEPDDETDEVSLSQRVMPSKKVGL